MIKIAKWNIFLKEMRTLSDIYVFFSKTTKNQNFKFIIGVLKSYRIILSFLNFLIVDMKGPWKWQL